MTDPESTELPGMPPKPHQLEARKGLTAWTEDWLKRDPDRKKLNTDDMYKEWREDLPGTYQPGGAQSKKSFDSLVSNYLRSRFDSTVNAIPGLTIGPKEQDGKRHVFEQMKLPWDEFNQLQIDCALEGPLADLKAIEARYVEYLREHSEIELTLSEVMQQFRKAVGL